MTAKSPIEVNYIKHQKLYSQQSRSQTRFQTDPDNKESQQFDRFCKKYRKNDHHFSVGFKRQYKTYRQINFESRQQNDAQPKSATQNMFEKKFRNNQDLPNKHAPNTYVSPHKPYNRCSSQSPFGNQNFTSRHRSCLYHNRNRPNQLYSNRPKSITPNARNLAFRNPHNLKYHSLSITPPKKLDEKASKLPRSYTPLPTVDQVVYNLE